MLVASAGRRRRRRRTARVRPARPAVRRSHPWAHWGRSAQPSGLPDAGGPRGRQAERNDRRQADEAWAEVLALAPDADTPGMRDQFLCHWQFAEFVEPGKTSWNLEPWRPVVDDARWSPPAAIPAAPKSRSDAGPVTRQQLAALVDHTLLKPEATAADVVALVAEAAELGVYAVCVSPSMVPIAVRSAGGGAVVAAVAGFPSGKHLSEVKAQEAALAVGGRRRRDRHGHRRRRRARRRLRRGARRTSPRCAPRCPDAVLKVIVESAALLELGRRANAGRRLSRRRGRRRRLRQDLDRVSSRGRRVACLPSR